MDIIIYAMGKELEFQLLNLLVNMKMNLIVKQLAQMVANKENKSLMKCLQNGNIKLILPVKKGTTCHEFAQSLWSEEWNLLPFDKTLKVY